LILKTLRNVQDLELEKIQFESSDITSTLRLHIGQANTSG